ncbi:MGMT family protein [Salmonella enterica subsp. enterica serovar Weltevreden]|nr:MGMT family protein [Salmonella enterica subsp. enterica serovar Weltevreden]
MGRRTVGTPFQRELWQALRAVPTGRAVLWSTGGAAQDDRAPHAQSVLRMALTPSSSICSCHRVIGHSGTLTGCTQAACSEKSELLLRHEGYLFIMKIQARSALSVTLLCKATTNKLHVPNGVKYSSNLYLNYLFSG